MNYSLNTLQLAMSVESDQASMEGHFDNLLTSAKEKLNGVFSRLKSFSLGNTKSADLENLWKKTNYMDVKSTPVNMTPNFTGDMCAYIDTLQEGVNVGNDIISQVLIPARKYFERIIGSPELLNSQSYAGDDPLGTAKLVANVFNIKQAIAKQHSAKDTASQKPFGDVYKTSGDFVKTYLKGKALLARCNTNPDLNPVKINAEVDKVNAILDTLQSRMKTNPDFQSNVETLRGISGIIFDIATLVEFYAGVYQMVNGVCHGHFDPTYQILETKVNNA